MSLKSLSAALLLSATLLSSCGEDTNTADTAAPTFDKAAMDNLLSGAVESGQTVGTSALVFDEGEIVYTGAFGFADKENAVPMSENTVVRIYSMTKPIMSVIILQMVEEGKIALNDPASKFIPEIGQMRVFDGMSAQGAPQFREPARDITIHDLLTHTSGIAYGIFGGSDPADTAYAQSGLLAPNTTIAQKMTILGNLPLVADPGTIWYYGFNTDVLGRIAEVVDEKPLEQIFDDRIFDPLGMDETGFMVRPDQEARFAQVYMMSEQGWVPAQGPGLADFTADNAYISGGGGLVSTLGDYAKFATAFLNDGGDLLKPETVTMMTSNRLDDSISYAFPWDADGRIRFGYGGKVVIAEEEAFTCQTGEAPGMWGWGGAARTDYVMDKDSGSFGIIFMQQFQAEDPQLHTDFRKEMWRQTRNSRMDWCEDKTEADSPAEN